MRSSRHSIQPAFDAITSIVDEIFAIEAADVDRATVVLAGFDSRPGIRRISALS
jgi:hypothetical protein